MGTAPQWRDKEEAELLLRFRKVEILASAVQTGIPALAIVLIFFFIYMMVRTVSGQTTLAQIGISFLGDIKISQAVSYVFGAGGLIYGLRERNLRHKKTRTLAEHAAKLERTIDPERTSSGLTPEGTTREGDRI